MGNKPTSKHQIDQIDNNKGYSKENCRWVTAKDNMQNTRLQEPNVIFEKNFLSIKQWAEKFNIHPDTIRWRLKHWGTLEKGKPCQYFKKLPRKQNEL
jgi:sugar diacid utilization regulator